MVRVPIEQRRPQLIAAATAVIARDGIAAATTRAIAAEAGVALGVVHYCYTSKDELIADVIIAATTNLTEAALEHITGEHGFRVGLRGLVGAMWGVVENDPGTQVGMYEMTVTTLRNRELAPLGAAQYDRLIALADRVIQAQLAVCGLRMPYERAALARLVEVFMDGLVLSWLVKRDSVQSMATVDVFIDLLARAAVPVLA